MKFWYKITNFKQILSFIKYYIVHYVSWILPRRRNVFSDGFFFLNRISPRPTGRPRRLVVLSSEYPGLSRRTLSSGLGTASKQGVDRRTDVTPFSCGIAVVFFSVRLGTRTAVACDFLRMRRNGKSKSRSLCFSSVHRARTACDSWGIAWSAWRRRGCIFDRSIIMI